MDSNLNYIVGFISLTFITLSAMYKLKLNKLQGTGRIPCIVSAWQRQILFLMLAVLSALIILVA